MGLLRSLFGFMIRKPDYIIGNPPYMLRWYILPRNKWFNIYLHHIIKSDDDRALHDHPWPSVSFTLKGTCKEYSKNTSPRTIRAGMVTFRSAKFAHRLELIDTCWTLFITGPRIRDWGFHCPLGWIPWQTFEERNGCEQA